MTGPRVELARIRRRVLPTLWPNVQTVVAAGGAWFFAELIPGHAQPLFAPIAAIVAMTAGRGRRGRAAVELILGVALGIVLADLFVRGVGTGAWQLIVVALATMTAATALGASSFVVTQSAVWSVIVVAFTHGSIALALSRFEDALVGGGVALLVAQLLFPLRPLDVVEEAAAESERQIDEVLHEVAVALRERDEERAVAAVRHADELDHHRLLDALAVGRAAARATPRRRRERRQLDQFADHANELRRAGRDARILAVGATRLLRDDEPPPGPLLEAVEELADGHPAEAVAAASRDGAGRSLAAGIVAQQVVSLSARRPLRKPHGREHEPA